MFRKTSRVPFLDMLVIWVLFTSLVKKKNLFSLSFKFKLLYKTSPFLLL